MCKKKQKKLQNIEDRKLRPHNSSLIYRRFGLKTQAVVILDTHRLIGAFCCFYLIYSKIFLFFTFSLSPLGLSQPNLWAVRVNEPEPLNHFADIGFLIGQSTFLKS